MNKTNRERKNGILDSAFCNAISWHIGYFIIKRPVAYDEDYCFGSDCVGLIAAVIYHNSF